MSYLTLPAEGIPALSQAVISLWFRIPQASIDAAASKPHQFFDLMISTIPLLTFGEPQQQTEMIGNVVNLAGEDASGYDPLGPPIDYGAQLPGVSYSAGEKHDLNPCFIAVDCSDVTKCVLVFNLQTKGIATGSGGATDAGGESLEPVGQDEVNRLNDLSRTPGSGVTSNTFIYYDKITKIVTAVFNHWAQASGLDDHTNELLAAKPELFYVKTVHPITPDQWHHLLLSFDLSSAIATKGPPANVEAGTWWNNVSEGTTGYAKLWYAIDDVNYSGRETDADGATLYHLGPYCVDHDTDRGESPGPRGGDPNGILTQAGWETAFFGSAAVTAGNQPLPTPEYAFSDTVLPVGAELGIPASSQYVDSILRVEMAEFQMFTEVTLDTSVEGNRRAFIDYVRDDKGNPIVDRAGSSTLKPVDPTKGTVDDPRPPAEILLGKRPDILLHTSKNWIAGANTGSTGVSIDPESGEATQIPGGQFQPVAAIRKYTPDPSIVG